ncbi:MAG: ABC transporter ATP-binding protein [Bacteroidetes bacterium]|nr:ABC transporter ATP-binding protein [Bacteroidota bacterium]
MIKIENIEKSYGKSFQLNIGKLEFKRGSIITLMGPNGSGKTTLLKSILGLVIPEKGTITVNGRNISGQCDYRNSICYMPQSSPYPPNLKVKEIIAITKDIREPQDDYDYELFGLFGTANILEKRAGALSQGTRQRLSAALAFMFNSEIIVLDEPTAGLDPYSAGVLKSKILKEKNAGKLILLTTHIVNEVSELSDRLVFMLEGRVKVDREAFRNAGENGKEFREMVSKLFKENEPAKNN